MAVGIALTHCADPDRLTRFWALALGYVLPPAPAGFATGRTTGARSAFPKTSPTWATTGWSTQQETAQGCGSSRFPRAWS